MELKELAPSLTLCKLIPQEGFYNSVYWWRKFSQPWQDKPIWQVEQRHARPDKVEVFPAPTLQEIIKALPETIKMDFEGEVFHIYNDIPNGYGVANENMCDAALKLWLVTNGVKF